MTCCIGAVYKKNHCCYIGGDSCVSMDSFHITSRTHKVIYNKNHKDILWGCAGSIRMANLIMQDDKMFPEKADTDGIQLGYIIEFIIPVIKEYAESLPPEHKEFDLILAIKDRLYRVQDDYSVYQVDDFVTIGCGCCTAYGAMKAYQSLKELGYKKEYPVEGAILQSILISAGYDYGVDSSVTILKTETEEKQ